MPRRTYRTSRLGAVYTRHGRGEPLVLVHGLGHRRQAWEPVLSRLARHREVIALDLPGSASRRRSRPASRTTCQQQ